MNKSPSSTMLDRLDIARERAICLTAVQFFTKLRFGEIPDYTPTMLAQARGYFPLMGWLTSFSMVLVVVFFSQKLSPLVLAWFVIAAGVLMTGALHEDGFADCCDGFGGGWSAQKVLLIMKDSSTGVFANVGLLVLLGIKAAILADFAQISWLLLCWVIWQSQSQSRYLAAMLVDFLPYARQGEDSKAGGIAIESLHPYRQLLAAIGGLLPIAVAGYWQGFVALFLAAVVVAGFGWYSHRRIGGYTGDVLGAAQQLAEVMFLLTFILLIG